MDSKVSKACCECFCVLNSNFNRVLVRGRGGRGGGGEKNYIDACDSLFLTFAILLCIMRKQNSLVTFLLRCHFFLFP